MPPIPYSGNGSLASIVVVDHDDVLCSRDLYREWAGLKNKCEDLEFENYEVEKELSELQAELVDSLQKEVNQYGSQSSLVAQIMRLKDSLIRVKKHYKKDFEDTTEVCRAFEANRIVLQQKKNGQINSLKILEEKVVVAWHKSQEFYSMCYGCRVSDPG